MHIHHIHIQHTYTVSYYIVHAHYEWYLYCIYPSICLSLYPSIHSSVRPSIRPCMCVLCVYFLCIMSMYLHIILHCISMRVCFDCILCMYTVYVPRYYTLYVYCVCMICMIFMMCALWHPFVYLQVCLPSFHVYFVCILRMYAGYVFWYVYYI